MSKQRALLSPALLLIATFSLIGGCVSRTNAVPDDTFVEVMIELHLVEARRISDAERTSMRTEVFRRYGVTESAVRQKLTRLDDEPEHYAELYARVVDRLTEEATEITTLDAGF